jgi:hypothetical protein
MGEVCEWVTLHSHNLPTLTRKTSLVQHRLAKGKNVFLAVGKKGWRARVAELIKRGKRGIGFFS